MQISRNHATNVDEWKRMSLILVSGLLLFETLTGLLIFVLPFSIATQTMVFLHTLIGLIFLVPYTYYQLRHWGIYRTIQLSQFKLLGYMAMITVIVASVSGVILAYQAIALTKINALMDTIHLVSTFAFIAFTIPHILLIIARNYKARKQASMEAVLQAGKQFGLKTIYLTAICFALVVLAIFAYEPVQMQNAFPEDYSYLFGEERPFAPSLANTTTGGAFDPRSLSGSASCGTSGCHEQIYQEWSVSAHRYSAMDPAFQAVQNVMAEQNGPESTRYCGGCHDPISLFSGEKNLMNENLTNQHGYQEGVSCIACHSIQETDIKGNAHYVMAQPERYMFELEDGKFNRLLRDFIIRAYPEHHVESLQHRMFKSPEFCAACHKQFIDQEINKVGWVQLQNQYDNWRKSRWNHDQNSSKTIECRECHMPLLASDDPASGDVLDYNRDADDQKHRSHRFLGANQFVPNLLKLKGAEEHTELTERWLQGKIDIPEIADKWQKGPAVPLELVAPKAVNPGEQVKIQAVITNNKVGHDFPTGPLDIIQAWVELTVMDDQGHEVFSSGKRDYRNFTEKGSFIFKAEAVDQYGNLIDRHNLWEMVGVRYRRTLFPGFSDRAEYSFICSAEAVAPPDVPEDQQEIEFSAPGRQVRELTVTAKLMYRKVDQFLLNFLLGEEAGVTAPVTVVSQATQKITITNSASD